MADRTYLDWPFLDDSHRAMAAGITAWRDRELSGAHSADPSAVCRAYVWQLGEAGWLKYAVPRAYGGALDTFDVRSICLIRETLGYTS
jgi:acyl-CoA dehydrogenase